MHEQGTIVIKNETDVPKNSKQLVFPSEGPVNFDVSPTWAADYMTLTIRSLVESPHEPEFQMQCYTVLLG